MKKHILTSFFVDFVRGKTPLRVIVALWGRNCRRGAPLGLYRHQSRALCVMGWWWGVENEETASASLHPERLNSIWMSAVTRLTHVSPIYCCWTLFLLFLLENDFKEISSDVLTRSVLYLSHRLPKKLMTLSVNFLIGWPATVCCSACPAVYVLFSFSGRSSTAQPLASYRFELNILLLPLAVPLGDVSVSKREKKTSRMHVENIIDPIVDHRRSCKSGKASGLNSRGRPDICVEPSSYSGPYSHR